jgi:hypothetical protein
MKLESHLSPDVTKSRERKRKKKESEKAREGIPSLVGAGVYWGSKLSSFSRVNSFQKQHHFL